MREGMREMSTRPVLVRVLSPPRDRMLFLSGKEIAAQVHREQLDKNSRTSTEAHGPQATGPRKEDGTMSTVIQIFCADTLLLKDETKIFAAIQRACLEAQVPTKSISFSLSTVGAINHLFEVLKTDICLKLQKQYDLEPLNRKHSRSTRSRVISQKGARR